MTNRPKLIQKSQKPDLIFIMSVESNLIYTSQLLKASRDQIDSMKTQCLGANFLDFFIYYETDGTCEGDVKV